LADPLAAATRRLLGTYPELGEWLADWPAARRDVVAADLPVVRHLAVLPDLASEATRPLVEALVAAPGLAWRQTYATADLGAGFLDRYGWTELVGTRGTLASARLAVGFLLLGPATLYPRHRHAAEEIYIPLAGTAAWLRGDEGFVKRAPGVVIHHPPHVPHAMRTGAEPLLALYLWRGGDLAEKSTLG
jgi:hypothetical protein